MGTCKSCCTHHEGNENVIQISLEATQPHCNTLSIIFLIVKILSKTQAVRLQNHELELSIAEMARIEETFDKTTKNTFEQLQPLTGLIQLQNDDLQNFNTLDLGKTVLIQNSERKVLNYSSLQETKASQIGQPRESVKDSDEQNGVGISVNHNQPFNSAVSMSNKFGVHGYVYQEMEQDFSRHTSQVSLKSNQMKDLTASNNYLSRVGLCSSYKMSSKRYKQNEDVLEEHSSHSSPYQSQITSVKQCVDEESNHTMIQKVLDSEDNENLEVYGSQNNFGSELYGNNTITSIIQRKDSYSESVHENTLTSVIVQSKDSTMQIRKLQSQKKLETTIKNCGNMYENRNYDNSQDSFSETSIRKLEQMSQFESSLTSNHKIELTNSCNSFQNLNLGKQFTLQSKKSSTSIHQIGVSQSQVRSGSSQKSHYNNLRKMGTQSEQDDCSIHQGNIEDHTDQESSIQKIELNSDDNSENYFGVEGDESQTSIKLNNTGKGSSSHKYNSKVIIFGNEQQEVICEGAELEMEISQRSTAKNSVPYTPYDRDYEYFENNKQNQNKQQNQRTFSNTIINEQENEEVNNYE